MKPEQNQPPPVDYKQLEADRKRAEEATKRADPKQQQAMSEQEARAMVNSHVKVCEGLNVAGLAELLEKEKSQLRISGLKRFI